MLLTCLTIERVAPGSGAATMTNKVLPIFGKLLPLATCSAQFSICVDVALQSPGLEYKMLMLVMQKPETLKVDTKELIKVGFGDDMSLEQHNKNKAGLERFVQLKQQEARSWEKNFPRWSHLADQVRTLSKAEACF